MANLKEKDQYVYFIYSDTQFKERSRIEKSMSRVFQAGVVVINGKKYQFTEMSKKPINRYADCKLIAEGFKSKMTFIPVMSR